MTKEADIREVRVLIERGSDGSFGAYMPDDNNLSYGVIGDGDTAAAAIDDFKATYAAMRESFKAEGRPFEEVRFVFSYDLPSFLVYYAGLVSYAGLSKMTGISAAQLSQYVSGYRKPSAKTTARIQQALNNFGKELSQLQLV